MPTHSIILEGKIGKLIVGFTDEVFSIVEYQLEEGMRDVGDEYSFPILGQFPLKSKVKITVEIEEEADGDTR